MPSYYEQYASKLRKIADINHATAVLHWDKETYLPKESAGFRSQQIATLSATAHNEFVDSRFGRLLNRLTGMTVLDEKQMRNVELTLKDYNKATKFTEEFVRKKSLAISAAYHAWIKARAKNDYSIYAPVLQELIDTIREEVTILGWENHPYDACLDQYEPEMTVAELDAFFEGVKHDLHPLLKKIRKAKKVKNKFLRKHFPKDDQWNFGLEILKNLGYDFDRGRQDISEHPFTISFSPEDVRVTTRIDENDLLNMTWSCIHEGGHALYEQGLPSEEYGLPSGYALSLGIHESQSRLWENNVGRSSEFWRHYYPILQSYFPKQLKKVSHQQFFKGINTIKPNLIRTEADELHYHFHVLIRYEIEKAILAGELDADDLKDAWNNLYDTYLGLTPPDDRQGILQDIHWSHGSFGYFPTYSLGSFYAAQFFAAAENDIPKLRKKLKKGKTKQLLSWLRENVHRHGRTYTASELCTLATGEPLNTEYFVKYAKKKFGKIYEL